MDYDEIAARGELADYNVYDIGIRCFPKHADERYRNMLYLVAYDICQPRRLRRVANVCLDFGVRVEKSVFECDLAREDFDRLWRRLSAEMDEDEDAIAAYRICGSCVHNILSMGQVYRPGKRLCYIL